MKIAEVSKRYGLTTDTLRYYERVGLITNVPRNKSGVREYTDENLKQIEFVKCLRAAGLPIEILNQFFALVEQGDDTLEERLQLLLDQKEIIENKMAEIAGTLDHLNRKIAYYQRKIEEA